MEKDMSLLETVKEFCTAWFSRRDPEQAVRFVSQDVLVIGTGEHDEIRGIQGLKECVTPFEVEFTSEQENYMMENAGTAALAFHAVNGECEWHGQASFTLAREKSGDIVQEDGDTCRQGDTCCQGRWLIHQMHFSVLEPRQESREHGPRTRIKKNIHDARKELLASSVAGGLMGGYAEKKFPFYFIDEHMLEYLGYESEADFVEDIDGCLINCMHPGDRAAACEKISKQLAEKDGYAVEYRMRKKNGSYIYIKDIGRAITAEDGRPAVMSVCTDISKQWLEKQQNESMIKALHGGTMVCRVRGEQCIPVYLSEGIGVMIGYSRQELEEILTSRLEDILYPQDSIKIYSVFKKAAESQQSIEGTYRFRHKDGHYVWAMVIFQGLGEDKGVLLMHCTFMALSHQFELQNSILDGTETGVCAVDPQTYELCLANDAFFRIMDVPLCDYEGKKCFEVFEKNCAPREFCMLEKETTEPKEVYIPGSGKTVAMTVKKARWMDRDVVIEYLSDVTEQKKAQENLKLGEKRLATAIQHAGVQFWEYDIDHNRAFMSETSQQAYHLPPVMENFPESFLELGILHPDDAEKYMKLHEKLKNGAKDVMLEYRVKKPGEDYCWLLAHYTNSFDEEGRPVRVFATAEHIDRYKELEEQFAVVARLTGLHTWTMDMQNRSIYFNESDAAELGIDSVVSCRTEEEMRGLGLFHPLDVQKVWKKSREIFEGANGVSFKVRLKIKEKYRWNRISYTVIRSKGGVPVKAIGSSVDIHEHAILEERYEQELEYSASLQEPNLINKARCNITQGKVELYLSKENTAVTRSGAPYEEAEEGLVLSAVEQEDQEKIRRVLGREQVLEAYPKGENFYSFDYRRKAIDGTVFWANTMVRTYQNPATGDIMNFMYTYNIDDRKTAEAIVDRVVDTNFEYLTLFNVITGIVEKTIDKTGVIFKPEKGRPYESDVRESLLRLLPQEDWEEYLPKFKIKHITVRLEENGSYSISSEIMDPKLQELRHKLWVFNWFDKQHTKILCSRSDITEAYRQEQHQKEVLSAALSAAKQANTAKSDFLSRMSHEIRTPMNAIIGMTAIAAKSLGNEKQVADCINKIGISSRFLLSLINDILDMSRIESGKMVLRSEKILFKEFVTGVNTICHTQAASKDVEYECIVDPVLRDSYLGDAMKLQQVLINILGNAIKFTPGGGKVTLSIQEHKRMQKDAVVRFIINDTGIGMTEEFLPHLFEAFEQESVGITAGFGGTGLGLAISKNIVDMMGGEIQVRSVKDIGTEFTVDVKLGIPQEDSQPCLKKQQEEIPVEEYEFTGKRILLVEDQPINVEIAQMILEEVGFTVETAENGLRAVEMFSRSTPGYYDVILMDIRMPLMDGLQASSNIRKLANADARTIPIIAMTADAFDEDVDKSRAAGMNRHLSKPIDPPKLYRALYDFIYGKR